MLQRAEDVVLDVSGLVGIDYVPGGRSLCGVDCWGLVWLAMQRVHGGPELPRDPAEMLSEGTGKRVADAFRIVRASEAARMGDLAMMTGAGGDGLGGDGQASGEANNEGRHVGIAIDRHRFLHAARAGKSSIASVEFFRRMDPGFVLYRARCLEVLQ